MAVLHRTTKGGFLGCRQPNSDTLLGWSVLVALFVPWYASKLGTPKGQAKAAKVRQFMAQSDGESDDPP